MIETEEEKGIRLIRRLTSGLESTLLAIPKDLSMLDDDEEFMEHLVPLLGHTIDLMNIVAALAPDRDVANKGWPFQAAVIVGHYVRLRKLLEGQVTLVVSRKLELAEVFTRPIYETDARMRYLMTRRRASFRSFVLTSYQPERDMLDELKARNPNARLDKIGKRIRSKVTRRLRQDRISVQKLRATRNWKLDGLSIRDMVGKVYTDRLYKYGFGVSSHYTHGDWLDLTSNHLKKRGRRWVPQLRWRTPRPEIVTSPAFIGLQATIRFVKWGRLDNTGSIETIVTRIYEAVMRLDSAHEDRQQ